MMKRKVKNKMIKGNLLREKIDACGFKLVYVAKQVGISYQAFYVRKIFKFGWKFKNLFNPCCNYFLHITTFFLT